MAAGLGFKDFTTGEVLTAADVDGYLMQGIWVFANAAARDAAVTSPQEGNCCYLKDTDAVQTYSGSAWVGFDDSNAIQNSIVDAKGDIVAASGNDTPARLAVGADGTTIVADSSTATGLAYIPTFFAGKNKIINGDFNINQRAFSSNTTSTAFNFDRFSTEYVSGTLTTSAQTFTAGTAPVTGYESTNFVQLVTASQSGTSAFAFIAQKIEDVRTYANQTVTLSFWAKASTGTPNVGVTIEQIFGSGGSSTVATTGSGSNAVQAITSSWARYSYTVTIPSISGKTIGTGSNLRPLIFTSCGSAVTGYATGTGVQNVTIQIWGVQLEAGSSATSFQTATGTIQGELAACQRYYWRQNVENGFSYFASGAFNSTTIAYVNVVNPVVMRISPSSMDYSSLFIYDFNTGITVTTATLTTAGSRASLVGLTVASGGVQYRPIIGRAESSGYIGFSAEL